MIFHITFGKRNIQTIERRPRTKDGLQLAEQVLRDTQNRFGRPHSSTYLFTKFLQHENNPKYKDINEKLYKKGCEYDSVIDHTGVKTVDRVTLAMPKETVYYGNCGHCAKAVQNYPCTRGQVIFLRRIL